MSKRAAIYARVSTDDQRGNYSIPTQLAECVRRADLRGYAIVGNRYVDSGTGRDAPMGNGSIGAFVDDYTSRELSRPSLDLALQFLETVGFDVLLVHALDRLARDPYIRETLEREFEKRGARVEYVLGDYDESAEGEVRKDLDATFAKWENAKRVERSLRGKRGKAERGLFVAGRAPFGFRIDKKALGGLAVSDERAAIVRRIFNMFVIEGKSLTGTADLLTKEGVPTYNGKKKWQKSTITKILRNPVYIGRCYFNKHKRNGKRLIKRDASEWIEIQVTPIIDKAIFDEAQRRLKENGKALRRSPSRFYLLSGKVFCAVCKRAYHAQAKRAGKQRRKNEALHYRHRIKQGHCLNRVISARVLEALVWNEIVKVMLNPARLRKGYKEHLAQQKASRARQQSHLETLRQKIIKLDQERQNLTAAYIDPDIKMSKIEYVKQKTAIDAELKSVRAEIERIEADLSKVPTPIELKSLEKYGAAIRRKLAINVEPAPLEKRALLDVLHVKVWIDKSGKKRVDGWYQPQPDGESSTTC